MKTFDFYQDRKVTCWERTQFSIEAESYKEALEIIKSWGGEDVLCFEDDKQIMVQTEKLYMKHQRPFLLLITEVDQL